MQRRQAGGRQRKNDCARAAGVFAHAEIVCRQQFFQVGVQIAIRHAQLALELAEGLLAGASQKATSWVRAGVDEAKGREVPYCTFCNPPDSMRKRATRPVWTALTLASGMGAYLPAASLRKSKRAASTPD